MLDILFILLGIAGLWASTELIISGAVAIAASYGLSEFFIGLVILAIGSDLPELAVALDTGIRLFQGANVSGIVTGSAIGSSFGQIGGVMGIAGLLGYLVLPRYAVFKYGAVLLGSILILGLVGHDGQVNRIDGLILLVLFFLYFFILINDSKNKAEQQQQTRTSIYFPLFRLAGGLVLIFLASNLTIDSCIRLSEFLGIHKSVISVVFIGFGTSLPELTISIGAIIKKKSALSVGNLIGSNIFDTLVPIGAAAVISPVAFAREFVVLDLPLLFLLTLLVLFFFLRKKGLQKKEALVLLLFYVGYLCIKISWATF